MRVACHARRISRQAGLKRTSDREANSEEEMIMRLIASALLALSLLAAVAVPASAFDPQTFFEQQKLNLP
jgi:hypothetical protein